MKQPFWDSWVVKGGVIVALLVAGWVLNPISFGCLPRDAACRRELTAFGEEIVIGEDAAAVIERCRTRSGECEFRCPANKNEKAAYIETPTEFGARNWIVVLPLSDDKIAGVRFRMLDSVKMKPDGSPSDRP